ncbi:IclR family transcriptional regulator [Kibdelosporangium phytohabitans]|uniref:IclR family transcriptional regulator n=1 Tax=Kibdelosporangium phytohabitans TaxID=860235 RepID=A0A0N9HWJ7_9PSEU|nr:IclR family transcriptional regulator C-terminal domain-containing protein [Kibdelosporangium phytohabitans]ALG06208.1 hypothetical protein AOZ06_04045 [Kibdelosporangium phytohabitans]MBE1465693.1 DNA-binding IclR family transcriptional regulator [Kibdelosporangium phytohabitans]
MGDDGLGSAEKALVILESFLAEAGMPAGVTELSQRTGLPKSTIHRLLRILCAFRLVERWSGKYALTGRMLELGELACGQSPRLLRAYLQPWLQELHNATHAIARATILCGRFEVCIGMACGRQSLSVATALQNPILARETAGGQAILAFLPRELQEKLVDETPRSSAEFEVVNLYLDLDRVRRAGWATRREKTVLEVRTVSAPVLDGQGAPIAALAVTENLTADRLAAVAVAVRAAAAAASRGLSAVSF